MNIMENELNESRKIANQDLALNDILHDASHVAVLQKGSPWIGDDEMKSIVVLPYEGDMTPKLGIGRASS